MEDSSFLNEDDQSLRNLKKNRLGDLSSLIVLYQFLKRFRSGFLKACFLILIGAIASIVSARLMGTMVEDGLQAGDKNLTLKLAGMVIFLEIFSLLGQWIGRRKLSFYAGHSILSIRRSLFNKLTKLPLKFFDREPQGRIVVRLTHDVEGVEEFFTSTLGRLTNALFSASLAFFGMMITDYRLGFFMLLAVIPAACLIFISKGKVRDVNRGMSVKSSALNSKLSEFLSGLTVIRSFGLEEWSATEFNKSVSKHHQAQLKANSLFAWLQPVTSFLVSLPLIVLVGLGGKWVLSGAIGVGVFVAFVRYCERFFMPLMMIAREVHMIQQAFTSAERVNSFLNHDEESEVFLPATIVPTFRPKEVIGNVEFKKVWMAYQDEDWVLKNVSFTLGPGEKIGLVGSTGCGKTTTVSLLSRLYEWQKGDIALDGESIRNWDRDFLRQNIGFVGQDTVIFKGSLEENLTVDPDIDESYFQRCLELTGLNEMLAKNKMRLDDQIFENGSNLSSGEKQLICLTRVLLQNPKILVLDEATANIDPFYEQLIHRAVEKLMENKTCLMIAHRLETIMNCDRLLVFDKGELLESGSPEELIASGGRFSELVDAKKKAGFDHRSEIEGSIQ